MASNSKPPMDAQLVVADAGGNKAVREALGVSRQVIENWRVVPPKWCVPMERISPSYTCEDMRPDIFYPDRRVKQKNEIKKDLSDYFGMGKSDAHAETCTDTSINKSSQKYVERESERTQLRAVDTE